MTSYHPNPWFALFMAAVLFVALMVLVLRRRHHAKLEREEREREEQAAEARRQFEAAEAYRARMQKKWDDETPQRAALAARLRADSSTSSTGTQR